MISNTKDAFNKGLFAGLAKYSTLCADYEYHTGKWYKLENDKTKSYTDTLVFNFTNNGAVQHCEYNRIYSSTNDI